MTIPNKNQSSLQHANADPDRIVSHWNQFIEKSSKNISRRSLDRRQAAFSEFLHVYEENRQAGEELIQRLSEIIESIPPLTGPTPSHAQEDTDARVFSRNAFIHVFPWQGGEGKPDLTEENRFFLGQEENTPSMDRSYLAHQSVFHHLITVFCGAFSGGDIDLIIPQNEQAAKPILCLLHQNAGVSAVRQVSVISKKNSRATVIVEVDDSAHEATREIGNILSLNVTVEENAQLELITLQKLSGHVSCFSAQSVLLRQNSQLDWTTIEMGGRRAHQSLITTHAGEGAGSSQKGIYASGGDQEYIFETRQVHSAPGTSSRLLFKGLHMGQSASSWKGNIFVEKGADQTDSYQANQNLVLSPEARVVSIPGLEILTGDVKCSHGATISNIDEGELFYLLSRGISKKEAVRMLALGYAEDVLKGLIKNPLFDTIIDVLKAKLDDGIDHSMRSDARIK